LAYSVALARDEELRTARFISITYNMELPCTLATIYGEMPPLRTRCPVCERWLTPRRGYGGATITIGNPEELDSWTDSIGSSEVILSERAVRALEREEIEGFEAHKVLVKYARVAPLQKASEMPSYYWLEFIGKIDIDRECFDHHEGTVCAGCEWWKKNPERATSKSQRLLVPVMDNWDGSDFVTIGNVLWGGYFCSRRVVELARKEAWTGIEFGGFDPHLPRLDLGRSDWHAAFSKSVKSKYPDFV